MTEPVTEQTMADLGFQKAQPEELYPDGYQCIKCELLVLHSDKLAAMQIHKDRHDVYDGKEP